jgi:hypothetical protein
MCNVIHVYILILISSTSSGKYIIALEEILILKYCPRIIFYIKNNLPERILWRMK